MRIVYVLLLSSACLLGANAQTEWKGDLQKAADVAKVLYQYLSFAANNIDENGANSRSLNDFEEIEDDEGEDGEDDEDEDDEDEDEDDDEVEAKDDETAEEAGDVTDGERRK